MDTKLIEACAHLGLNPREHDGQLTVSVGSGLMKRERTIDVTEAPEEGESERWYGGIARGLLAATSEPKNSRGAALDFLDTTPRLFATVETPGFFAAAEAALGEPAWSTGFLGDLRLAYRVELDNGQRLLPESQVTGWNVHPERVYKAALSIIFHRSGYEAWSTHAYPELTVDEFQRGDGSDAARACLLELMDFHRCRSGLYFAMPTPDHLLFIDADTNRLQDFKALAHRLYEESMTPLSESIWAYEAGKLLEEPVRR